MLDTNGAVRLLGGDGRSAAAAECLRRKGIAVRTYGVAGLENQFPDLETALRGGECVVLPMGAFVGETLKIGGETVDGNILPELLGEHAAVIAGEFPEALEGWLRERGLRCRALLEEEFYQVPNGAITAEGAVYLTMGALERTVMGARVLVIGWGRIGKPLARKLKALGAAVTVSARREKDLAEITAEGFRAEETGVWRWGGTYDAVLNTAPAPVRLPESKEKRVMIELASRPGGLPEGPWVIQAQGLPGVYAPRSAGEVLADAVIRAREGGDLE